MAKTPIVSFGNALSDLTVIAGLVDARTWRYAGVEWPVGRLRLRGHVRHF